MKISCLELNRGTGAVISKARKCPVILEKHGEPWVVMISYGEYEVLKSSHEFFSNIESKSLSEFLDESKDLFVKNFTQLKKSIHHAKLKDRKDAA